MFEVRGRRTLFIKPPTTRRIRHGVRGQETSMIKRSHQRHRRIAATTPSRHRTRSHHRIIQDAEAANANLRAFVKRSGRASFLYLDPPWSMGRTTVGLSTGSVSPELHYPTMSPKACRDFAWGVAAEKDAVCAMWCLVGQLPLALDMLKGQGFRYVTHTAWHKLRSKGGNAGCPSSGAVINCSELLILAVRGRGLPIDRTAPKFHSVMAALRTAHSEKPAIFRDMLAQLYPVTWDGGRTAKLELFARERARGWKAWGNQAPKKVGGQRRALRKAA